MHLWKGTTKPLLIIYIQKPIIVYVCDSKAKMNEPEGIRNKNAKILKRLTKLYIALLYFCILHVDLSFEVLTMQG